MFLQGYGRVQSGYVGVCVCVRVSWDKQLFVFRYAKQTRSSSVMRVGMNETTVGVLFAGCVHLSFAVSFSYHCLASYEDNLVIVACFNILATSGGVNK